MRDTIITRNRKKIELKVMLACFVVANLLNVASILYYHTEWVEMLTELGFVVCVSFVLYGLSVVIRLICWTLKGGKC